MKVSLKLNQIESQISALQSQKLRLLEDRQKEIADLIQELNLTHIEDTLLIGGLQFLKHKMSTTDPVVEAWNTAGERFLRHRKKVKNINPSQKDSYSQPTPQSSPKSVRS